MNYESDRRWISARDRLCADRGPDETSEDARARRLDAALDLYLIECEVDSA